MQRRTERLTIRALTLADATFVLRLLNERSFLANIGDRGVRTLEQAGEYLRTGPLASYDRHGHGLNLVELREGPAIGMCGLLRRERLAHPDLGYALLPEHTGAGYAREAAQATLDHARTELGLTTIQAVVKPDNARSIHLLERLGFMRVGMIALFDDHPPDALFERVSD